MAELGSDIAGVFDIDSTMSTATGRLALAEAILRRVTTPAGSLIDEPEYGYDVHELIGSTEPASVIESKVLFQVNSEEEVRESSCSVTHELTTGTVRIVINVIDAEGPFELTITAADKLTLEAFLDGELIAQLPEAA